MKKTISRLLAMLFIMSIGVATACKDSGESQGTQGLDVWGTYATAKVGQSAANNDNYVKTDAKIDVQMMRNETEGGQIIVTPDVDINAFDLKVSDLKAGDGKILPATQIDVYQQKYIEVRQKNDYNGVYGVGEYVPDMLLPMNIAVAYGENVIEKGNNQGIYVEFDSTGVEAGTYSGNFTLKCDGKEFSVPVSVEVWDIEYTGRRNFQSCFVMYQSSLLRSEYDSSTEMVDNYVEFFLDYKMNTLVQNSHYNDFDKYGEEWLSDMEKWKNNPNYNSIYIPYWFALTYTTYNSNGEPTAAAKECLKYITALAKKSTPEFSYIDYAYFYPFELDEADVVPTRQSGAESLLKGGGEIDQLLNLAVETLKEEGYFDTLDAEYAAHLENSILSIPTLFTNVNIINDWVDNYTATFCPYLSVFNNGNMVDRLTTKAEEHNRNVWAYTCVGPNYPYPTFHLDDYNLGSRISGWMEKYYGIDGYLYWATTNAHYKYEEYKYLDPYKDGNRYPGADGDGYLVYPGKLYGSDTPFPSLRLVAYRDSMDDYDMLSVYESLLSDYYKKNDLGELNFNEYVEDLYFELFNGAVYNLDDSQLFAARKELAKRINALQAEEPVLLKKEYVKNSLTITENAVAMSQDSSASLNVGELDVLLKTKMFNNEFGAQTVSFNPYVSIQLSGVNNVENLCFSMENTCDVAFDAYIEAIVDNMAYDIGSVYLSVGEERDIRLHIVDELDFSKPVTIRIRMLNVTANAKGDYTLYPDRSFRLSNLCLECQ